MEQIAVDAMTKTSVEVGHSGKKILQLADMDVVNAVIRMHPDRIYYLPLTFGFVFAGWHMNVQKLNANRVVNRTDYPRLKIPAIVTHLNTKVHTYDMCSQNQTFGGELEYAHFHIKTWRAWRECNFAFIRQCPLSIAGHF